MSRTNPSDSRPVSSSFSHERVGTHLSRPFSMLIMRSRHMTCENIGI